MKNIIANFLTASISYLGDLKESIAPTTVASAVASLDKAEAKLRKAVAYHDAKAAEHEYAMEVHEAAMEAHANAQSRAKRVANKIAELTA